MVGNSIDPFKPGSTRTIVSPVTQNQLRPLEAHCRVVILETALSDQEHALVADFLKSYPNQRVSIGGRELQNVSFLKHYPFLTHIRIGLWFLNDLSGIESLSEKLEILELGGTKSESLSLSMLGKFKNLKSLNIEGSFKDFLTIKKLHQLERLNLRSFTLPNLKAIDTLGNLMWLHIGLGGTKSLAGISNFEKLREIQLWKIRGLADLNEIGRIESLEKLSLSELKQTTSLPSFERLNKLKRLYLYCLKGVSDLSPISAATELEELLVLNCHHFEIKDFQPLAGLKKLRRGLISIGGKKKNSAVEALLHLEKINSGQTPQPT